MTLSPLKEKVNVVIICGNKFWRTPKSRVEPTWKSNYVELQKVGIRKALSTSNTKKG
jgi:hypothetical protein